MAHLGFFSEFLDDGVRPSGLRCLRDARECARRCLASMGKKKYLISRARWVDAVDDTLQALRDARKEEAAFMEAVKAYFSHRDEGAEEAEEWAEYAYLGALGLQEAGDASRLPDFGLMGALWQGGELSVLCRDYVAASDWAIGELGNEYCKVGGRACPGEAGRAPSGFKPLAKYLGEGYAVRVVAVWRRLSAHVMQAQGSGRSTRKGQACTGGRAIVQWLEAYRRAGMLTRLPSYSDAVAAFGDVGSESGYYCQARKAREPSFVPPVVASIVEQEREAVAPKRRG